MTTPFWSLPQSYPGVRPVQFPTPTELRSKSLYLGDPTSSVGMVELTPPDKPSVARSRGRVVKNLWGGGTAVIKFPSMTRSWSFPYPAMSERDWQVLAAFDDEVSSFGSPPYVLVEPEGVNRLTTQQSMCSGGWSASGAGSVSFTTPTAPYITPGGTMQWLPSAAGESLIAANIVSGTFTPDTAHCAVNLPAEFLTFSCWVWKSAGTAQFQARIRACNADGSGNQVISGPTITVGTTWQQVSLTVGPGAFGTLPYLFPVFGSIDGGQFRVSNPMLTYTSQPMPWARGSGAPRVVIASDIPRDLSKALWTTTTLVLAEAYPCP